MISVRWLLVSLGVLASACGDDQRGHGGPVDAAPTVDAGADASGADAAVDTGELETDPAALVPLTEGHLITALAGGPGGMLVGWNWRVTTVDAAGTNRYPRGVELTHAVDHAVAVPGGYLVAASVRGTGGSDDVHIALTRLTVAADLTATAPVRLAPGQVEDLACGPESCLLVRRYQWALFAIRVGHDGRVSNTAGVHVTGSINVSNPATVVWTGSAFAVSWLGATTVSGPRAVQLVRFDRDGQPIDSAPIPVSPVTTADHASIDSAAVAGQLVVAWSYQDDPRRTLAARVAASGAVLDREPLVIGDGRLAAVVASGDRHLVATVLDAAPGQLLVRPLALDGTLGERREVTELGHALSAIAVIGDHLVVAQSQPRSAGPLAYLRRFATGADGPLGTALDATPRHVAFHDNTQIRPALASWPWPPSAPTAPLLASRDNRGPGVATTVVDHDGPWLGAPRFALPDASYQTQVAASADGFYATWVQTAAGGSSLMGCRLDATGTVIGGPRRLAPVSDLARPVVSSDGQSYLVLWSEPILGGHHEANVALLHGIEVTADGQAGPIRTLHRTDATWFEYLAVTWSGDHHVLSWQQDGRIRSSRLAPGADAIEPPRELAPSAWLPSVATTASGAVAIAWLVCGGDGGCSLAGTWLDDAGDPAVAFTSDLDGVGAHGPPQIAGFGDELAVVVPALNRSPAAVLGLRVAGDGSVTGPFVLAEAPFIDGAAIARIGPSRLLVAYGRKGSARYDVMRVRGLRLTLGGDGATCGTDFECTGSVCGAGHCRTLD